MSRRQSSATKRSINYRASREKSTQPTTNTRSSMKTIIFALKHRWTVKQLIACSTEQLLVVNNSPILLGAPGETTSSGHPSPRPLGNYLLLDTLPLLISVFLRACVCVWGGGEGGRANIFWEYTMRYEVRFQTIDSGKFVVCLEMSVHLLRTYTVRPPWGQRKSGRYGKVGVIFWGVERGGTCLLWQVHAYCSL